MSPLPIAQARNPTKLSRAHSNAPLLCNDHSSESAHNPNPIAILDTENAPAPYLVKMLIVVWNEPVPFSPGVPTGKSNTPTSNSLGPSSIIRVYSILPYITISIHVHPNKTPKSREEKG
jgi:hypothetical protein